MRQRKEENQRLELTGGEMFTITWKGTDLITIITVLQVDQDCYFLVNVSEDLEIYWRDYSTIQDEQYTLQEVLEYLEYLIESDEAEVEYWGNLMNKKTFLQLQERGRYAKTKKVRILNKEIFEQLVKNRMDMIRNYYLLLKSIQSLSVNHGDVLTVYSCENQLISQERVIKFQDRYYLLPIHRNFDTALYDDGMSREEITEFLYTLVVEEKSRLIWHHLFGEQITVFSNTMTISKETDSVLEWNVLKS